MLSECSVKKSHLQNVKFDKHNFKMACKIENFEKKKPIFLYFTCSVAALHLRLFEMLLHNSLEITIFLYNLKET